MRTSLALAALLAAVACGASGSPALREAALGPDGAPAALPPTPAPAPAALLPPPSPSPALASAPASAAPPPPPSALLEAVADAVRDAFAVGLQPIFARLDGLSTALADSSARLDGLSAAQADSSARLDGVIASQADSSARLDGVIASQADSSARLADVIASQADSSARLADLSRELADAVPTTTSAARANATAFASVWFVENPRHCSAFKYAGDFAGAAPVFLTAAHCFANASHAPAAVFFDGLHDGMPVVLRQLGDDRAYECTVVFATPPPGDAAVLDCPDALSGVALARASPPRSLTVTAIGFVEDSFPSWKSPYHVSGASGVAVNVLTAHVANVAGPLPQGGSCKPTAATEPPVIWPVTPAGFFDIVIEPGMSGGPLLDARGGVLGIIHGHACRASAFVSLDAVDAYLGERAR